MFLKLRTLLFLAFIPNFQTLALEGNVTKTITVVSTTQRTETCQDNEHEIFNTLNTKISQIQGLIENERQLNEQLRLQLLQTQKIIENERKLNEQLEKRLETNIQEVANYKKNESLPRTCREVYENGNHVTGIYVIQPEHESFAVLCEMNIRGGGWTVFHNRFDGSQNFYLDWIDFKGGFGSFLGEFWLGLERLHQLTSYRSSEMLVELTDLDNKIAYASYGSFSIGNEGEGYALKTLRGFTGDAGDSLSYQIGMKFSTKDRDQDIHTTLNCAVRYTGAGWHKDCLTSNLNGRYLKSKTLTGDDVHSGMHWRAFHGGEYSLLKARMMIRPH